MLLELIQEVSLGRIGEWVDDARNEVLSEMSGSSLDIEGNAMSGSGE